MSKHQKRHEVPKNWPVPRKGSTFVISRNSLGVPVLVVLRDLLGFAQNRSEVKKAIHKRDLLVSNKPVIDEKKSMELFDVLTIVPSKKNYRLILSENGKYSAVEIQEKEANEKVSKVIGKKTLSNKKTQLNLYDGRNFLSDIKCSVGDSVIIDLKKNSISKVLPLKEKAEVLVINGKHAGSRGTVNKILTEDKLAEIKSGEDVFNVLIKQLMVTN